MEPFTGADLQRMAYQSGGDEELEELWDKSLIVGFCKGLSEEEILDMSPEDILSEGED
jgi:hypothetical protein